jgi:nucleoside-diphosphate-sugar epimerase
VSRILVTGGTGFIGSALVKQLVRAGNQVRVFDNNSRGNSRRLAEFAKEIEFIDGDIRDLDALMGAADAVDELHQSCRSASAGRSKSHLCSNSHPVMLKALPCKG